ncbi:hypothetical protein HOY34_10560 [Xinfangfangia sp. D13-10-4-6]|uniref:hypothetical protein n=1 Tax=Pseudogemmobacter hezensis TaxID=2737662 RepID=UPI001555966B|nr:hypothetical protein [Pseudogemmobacter hezensis]NPD15642.1 hypothetical protein [Pseudogemmobacter hezensis]
MNEADADHDSPGGKSGGPPTGAGRRRGRWRIGLRLGAFLILLALMVGFAGIVLTGRTLTLPVWAVAGIEDRLNRQLGTHLPEGSAVSLGEVSVMVGRDLSPRLMLTDLRLLDQRGTALVSLPELRIDLEPLPLLTGQVRPRLVRMTGAQIAVARDADGRIALSFAGLSGAPAMGTPAEILDALDRMFSGDALASLGLIEIEGLALTLDDARARRKWQLGDGRLVLTNRDEGLTGELSVTLLAGADPARASLVVETSKADSSARFSATIDHVAARDLAVQAAPLAAFAVLDAPISGRLSGALDADGKPGLFEGSLSLGAGALDPGALRNIEAKDSSLQIPAPPDSDGPAIDSNATSPPANLSNADGTPGDAPAALPVPRVVGFDSASIGLRYDAGLQRVYLDQVTVESASLRFSASGTTELRDEGGGPLDPGELPHVVISQLKIGEVMVDPDGLFEAPVRFGGGSAVSRLTLEPFRIEIGEVALQEDDERLVLRGDISADGNGRWSGAVDVALNRISSDRLIRLWPLIAVPRTRTWLAENVGEGELSDVAAAIRFQPGEEPRFALDYEFSGAAVRVIRSLPPITNGRGRAAMQDNVYTLVVEGGEITAPGIGANAAGEDAARITVDGSLFRVPDIRKKPADAEVRLIVDAGLTATLSLLDQEPFRFISKAGRQVDLGEGRAVLVADLRFPLLRKLKTEDIRYDVTGRILDFRSDRLVPGKEILSPDLAVKVTPAGMTLSGAGSIASVPIVARYEQPFGKDAAGRAQVRGTAKLSDAGLRKLGVQLPQGWLSGETQAEAELALPKGQPARLTLKSDLRGLGLSVPPLSWRKTTQSTGRLLVEAVLGAAPEVTKLELNGPGLAAKGRLTTKAGGGLDRASFSEVKAGGWLDATVELTGRGKGADVTAKLTGGTLDLRELPKSGGGAGGAGAAAGQASTPIEVNLDRLVVTSGIALTGLSGTFTPRQGGLEGRFVAAVNGKGQIGGATIPYKGGTAVRITANDAGRVMAAAGLFDMGRGGSLDMTIQPRDTPGQYSGVATVTGFSIQNAPVLAELLSAASVVGLLEQLNGGGIQFSEGDASFLILPEGVQIARGAAIGASMGISFSGFYHSASNQIDIQGTISPIYLLNGIGQIFTRKGEGLFGFNYRLAGPAKSPQISVNPLSILTPGMFRDIFRRPAPVLKGAG